MAIHDFILHNGELRRAGERVLSPGQLGLLSGWGVFTTLRVIDGAAFAWERHWARMNRDARLIGVALPFDPEEIERDLMRLVEANGRPDCTMRVAAVRNGGGFWEGPDIERETDLIALTADLNKWSETVRLGVQPHARYAADEFSGAKILSWAQNLRWVERAHERGLDEVILLNERDCVAECTSANIFMVRDSAVLTPPLTDGCLPGVTREILLECRVPALEIREETLRMDDLYAADAVFITSTTRNLLPVAEIEGRPLSRRDEMVHRLDAWLSEFTRADIERRKLAFRVGQT